MLTEGTKTCRLCGHVLWRDEEKEVCLDCKHNWHIIAQAWLEILPNKACSRQEPAVAVESQVACGSCG